jgi:DNA polymerase-3 subunit beta
MKLTVLQENLARALNTSNRSVATRAQLPILSNVLLEADKGRLKVSATNLETGINLWLGANVEKEGKITVPAKILTEFVASLPTDKVEMEVKDNSLFLNCASFQANFVGLPASEFPLVPSLTEEANISFSGKIFSSAVSQVTFAAATDEGRPVLTGVLLAVKEGKLIFVATDGYRLSVREVDSEKSAKKKSWEAIKEFKEGLIIPARTLAEVSRVVGESETKKVEVAVTPKASQAIFALSEAEVVSRLIEGSFPDYEQIIPDKRSTKATMEKEDLLRAVKMAAIFARESANIIKFEIKSNKLKVSANTAQVGGNLSEVEAKVEGKGEKIAFNSRYLLDFLNVVDSQQVIFEMGGSLNPGVFKPVGETSFLHIIMPVRVQE